MKKTIISYLLFTLLMIGLQSLVFAQDAKYWIQFTDKDTAGYDYSKHLSNRAIENRKMLNIPLRQETDIPLKKEYLYKISQKNIQTISHSKWLNAVSADLDQEQIDWLKKQPYVKKVVLIDRYFRTLKFDPSDEMAYATAISQMEPRAFGADNLTAKGVIVGVIDAGFYDCHRRKSLSSIFEEERVLGARDFVNPEREDLFRKPKTHADSHGTKVLEMIAGQKMSRSKQFGFATGASFYLARTDDGNNEFRGEEDYWIAAMEWMDSLGVRIINTSLGYALGFDDPNENYHPSDMDGKTAMISKAAQIAADEKGLLLVVSAGNEGLDPDWRIVSAPADVEGVLSVGATTHFGNRASYSSIGPTSLDYLKPNVVCYSLDGTSFSAPVITGFAACLLEKKPTATNKELIKVIEQSASLYPYGNNYVGYGVPKASKAINLLNDKTVSNNFKEKVVKGKDFVLLKASKDESVQYALVYHKTNEKHVWKEQGIKISSKGKIKLKRPKKAVRSTVIIDSENAYEIIWE